ncbi:predicted protein [Chaetoceros tenuissimus]|uniref:Uncharacterized protein n=1 Tax=Chaetoceros tenuissimus TaxID=426638 RepID=A0AAD3HBM9_9STRA|nr:predicted protein [Chaetoceros tenuissimus]
MADIGEPYLNCKSFTLTKINDTHITEAITFCKNLFDKSQKKNKNKKKKNSNNSKKNNKKKDVLDDVSECIVIRQTEYEKKKSEEKRLAWNGKLEMMQQRDFYKAIERKVLQAVKKVQKEVDSNSTDELEVKQFAILCSLPKCKKQIHHYDNKYNKRYKRYYIILSLMEGTTVSVKIEGNEGVEHIIGLSPKAMLLFNDRCYHAGGEYQKTNFRFYFMIAPKDMPEEGLNDNTIQLATSKGVLCSYCLEKTIKSKEVLQNRTLPRAFYEHRKKCKQYWMIEHKMSDDEAEQEALYWIGEKMESNAKSNAKRNEKKEEANEQGCKRKYSNIEE